MPWLRLLSKPLTSSNNCRKKHLNTLLNQLLRVWLEGGLVRAIHYRAEEAIYVKASHDRVTVIFSTVFREETDRIFGKVFLQEFVDARRRAIQNAPQVLFPE